MPSLRALAPLFVVQFACWTGMFLLWIGAYPAITLAIMPAAPGDALALRRGLLVLAGCFTWYALLAACLAFLIPRLLGRVTAPVLLGLAVLVGAGGLASLGWIASPWALPASFTALAVGWCALANLPYTIAARLVGGAGVEHAFRIFAFSSILPQLAVTMALIFVIGEIDAATARAIMRAAGLAMATGGLLALALRHRLAGAGAQDTN